MTHNFAPGQILKQVGSYEGRLIKVLSLGSKSAEYSVKIVKLAENDYQKIGTVVDNVYLEGGSFVKNSQPRDARGRFAKSQSVSFNLAVTVLGQNPIKANHVMSEVLTELVKIVKQKKLAVDIQLDPK